MALDGDTYPDMSDMGDFGSRESDAWLGHFAGVLSGSGAPLNPRPQGDQFRHCSGVRGYPSRLLSTPARRPHPIRRCSEGLPDLLPMP